MIRQQANINTTFLWIKGMLLFFLLLTASHLSAQTETKQEPKANPEEISMKQRFGIRTNAVDWLLTIPNVAVEFDLGNTIRNKRTISAGLKYNWDTSHKITPSTVFNVLDARVEWRQYFRTRKRGAVTSDPDLMTRLKEQVFTTKRKNPRTERAYFWGVYAHASNYSFKLGKEGKQGTAYGAGLSLGYTAPLYGYEKGNIDLEMGGSIGLIYNAYDFYTYDQENYTYSFDASKSKSGHLVPFPLITDLRVAFVYRHMSVSAKYKESIERRIQRITAARNIINQEINKMRFRIDSIDSAVRKQGGTGPDSLLNKEELKQWRLMQKERKAEQEKEQEKKLREEVAASLGIALSDTLSSKDEKAIRKEMEIRMEKIKKAAEPVDPEKAEKQAAKDAKKAAKEAEKATKKSEKKDKKKDKKAEAEEPEKAATVPVEENQTEEETV
ncbi:MAG: DUF3575 domain-containing protein [Bacteroides sp.]|nr:DUF3575 domain-containing protein [Bacteroides sp.]